MAILLATDQWPFVFTQLDGQQTMAQLEEHISDVNRLFERRQMFAQITWLKGYTRDTKMNDRVARWFKESHQAMKDYCVGVGHVSSSGGFRFALSAIFLIKPLACPHSVDATFDEALVFVRKQAARRGLTLPAEVRRPWSEMP
jgi:hypothetical protein